MHVKLHKPCKKEAFKRQKMELKGKPVLVQKNKVLKSERAFIFFRVYIFHEVSQDFFALQNTYF